MRRQGSGHARLRCVLVTALRPAGGGGVLPRLPDGCSLLQSPRAQARSLRLRQALVLEYLPLADAIACAAARRLFPLVERDDLIQVAREALVRSAPRCRAGEPAAPYLSHWVELLKESPRVLLQVLGDGRRAADLICPESSGE
jgi:hypothetical protein